MKIRCADFIKLYNTHFVNRFEKFAQKEYKWRHLKKVHWDICKKYGLEHTKKWYKHVPEGAVEIEEVLWDIGVQCDNVIGKKTRHNCNWQERAKRGNHQYCCTTWCKSKGKRNGESGKVSSLKESDRKIVEICACRDRSPWKCLQRIW